MAPIIKEANEIEEARSLMPRVTRIYNALDNLKVNSPATWLEAGEKIIEIKELAKEIKRVRKTILDPINTAKDNTMAFFDPPLNKCEEIVNGLGKRMSDWKNEQERIEKEKREKAEAEAAEKERIEKTRLRKEAEKKEEEAREAERKALAAQNNGQGQKAQEFVEKAQELKEESKELKEEAREVEVDAKEIKPKAEKIEGLSFRRIWKFKIVNPGKIPIQFCSPDEVKIGKTVRECKDKTNIPGVEIFFEDVPIGD